jgi:cytochrome c biogenesis protein CcmG/thiol:disulfide interchange protein DsbE
MKRRLIIWLPLVLFVVFAVTVAMNLYAPSDRIIHSRMIGKPVPDFVLEPALPGRPGLSGADLASGSPRIVNVFASWCIPCIAEAPQLMALSARGIPIDAIAIRDRPEDIATFLAKWGDPYRAIGSDTDSRVQIALGSSGVPETFVIDGKGIVRHQHIGEIRPEDLSEIIAAYEGGR